MRSTGTVVVRKRACPSNISCAPIGAIVTSDPLEVSLLLAGAECGEFVFPPSGIGQYSKVLVERAGKDQETVGVGGGIGVTYAIEERMVNTSWVRLDSWKGFCRTRYRSGC